MTYRIRVSLLLLGCLVVLALLALLMLYIATRHVPGFYREAMEIPQGKLEKGSDRMLRQAAALESAVNKEEHWEVLVTAEEINGWLAVDLEKNHPNALPPTLRDPRVAIDKNGITVACRFEQDGTRTILSLTIAPSVPEPNVVALRIVLARAGLLPMPLEKVFDRISKTARKMQLHLECRGGDDPVALLSLPDSKDDGRIVRIETIRLGDGEIYIAGTTKRKEP